MTRRQTQIIDTIARLAGMNQRTGANQIAAAMGLKRDAVRRECAALVAAGHLTVTDRGSQQAGIDYTIAKDR
jgi:predicted ArsR family transcriptional regulator